MSDNGRPDRPLWTPAGRRRAQVVSGLRGLARARQPDAVRGPETAPSGQSPDSGRCDLCRVDVPDDHRHLLHLEERRILCVCESCWAIRSGDPELRPVGSRTRWLPGFRLPEDLWASLGIPIGLAFFMHSTVTDCVVALYPSPAGATESELRFDSWSRMRELNPVLEELEPDGEALIVNRLSTPRAYAIAPIDRCYMLVGLIKANWEGISGGSGVERAVAGFFDDLRAAAGAPA